MKTGAIVFTSRTGHTQQYAQMLGQALEVPVYSLEEAVVQGYMLGVAQFFEPELDIQKQEPKELLRRLINVHIAPSPLCRAAYTEQMLKNAVLMGAKQYVIQKNIIDKAGADSKAFEHVNYCLAVKKRENAWQWQTS